MTYNWRDAEIKNDTQVFFESEAAGSDIVILLFKYIYMYAFDVFIAYLSFLKFFINWIVRCNKKRLPVLNEKKDNFMTTSFHHDFCQSKIQTTFKVDWRIRLIKWRVTLSAENNFLP